MRRAKGKVRTPACEAEGDGLTMNQRNREFIPTQRGARRRPAARRRGVAAVLAMMFLVIFGSLAAAMAIVSQGNLRTAESHLKINRTLAAAETGMLLMEYQFAAALRFDGSDSDDRPDITTTDGIIHDGIPTDTDGNVYGLWQAIATQIHSEMTGQLHNQANPSFTTPAPGTTLHGLPIVELNIGPIRVGPGEPDFTAKFTPHPLPGEDYDSAEYDRLPYGPATTPEEEEIKEEAGIDWVVSNAAPLDGRFIRIKVTAYDDGSSAGTQAAPGAPEHRRVYRSVSKDVRITKRIPFAILSRSRVMIGRNVMVDGAVGSHFSEVNLTNGHPVQVLSDFRGLDGTLDSDLDALVGTLITNDVNGDNRLNIASSSETSGIADPAALDIDGDGYISDFDFFLAAFDGNGDNRVTASELGTTGDPSREQLFEMIDALMSPNAYDSNGDGIPEGDGFIDGDDFYAKIRGEVSILATQSDWESGAAGGAYQDYVEGSILPDYGHDPITFDDQQHAEDFQFTASDFNIAAFADDATTDVAAQAAAPVANEPSNPTEYVAPSAATREAVPFGAAYPYDYFDRPVYRNMVFDNVKIPKGTNALFEDCKFIGVTYIETEPVNDAEDYNYAGMQNADGSFKHPDRVVTVNGTDYGGDPVAVGNQAYGTKLISNNVRFHNCTFEGAIVSGNWTGGSTSDQPAEYTHTRNKVAFTGNTEFNIEDSTNLSDDEKDLFQRSTLLLPHFSVEMGSFDDGYASSETVKLSGTIVAGLIDMRGQVEVEGTVVTTFEPISDTGPVIGDTSPQFNTTLGYFDSASGDLEAELPSTGLGKITLRYNPNKYLPDGIDGPLTIEPLERTFKEGGK